MMTGRTGEEPNTKSSALVGSPPVRPVILSDKEPWAPVHPALKQRACLVAVIRKSAFRTVDRSVKVVGLFGSGQGSGAPRSLRIWADKRADEAAGRGAGQVGTVDIARHHLPASPGGTESETQTTS